MGARTGTDRNVTISVITPSLNMLDYLKRCCASVADQGGPTREHIVADGESTDGTVEWLRGYSASTSIIGKDQGMYDAINKGLAACHGAIVSYLSCDEQYLPGTLAHIERYFAEHPHVDGVFGDTLVTWPDGQLISFQKTYVPIWQFIVSSHLYAFPSSMFLRRKVIDNGDVFNPTFKYSGDSELVVRLLRKGYRLRTTRRYLSAFTITGSNRGQELGAQTENERIAHTLPAWVSRLRLPLNIARLTLKFASGSYFERPPLRYALYVSDAESGRASFEARDLSPRWRTTAP